MERNDNFSFHIRAKSKFGEAKSNDYSRDSQMKLGKTYDLTYSDNIMAH